MPVPGIGKMEAGIIVALVSSMASVVVAGFGFYSAHRLKLSEAREANKVQEAETQAREADDTAKVQIRKIDQSDEIRAELAGLWRQAESDRRSCEDRERKCEERDLTRSTQIQFLQTELEAVKVGLEAAARSIHPPAPAE